MGWRAYRTHACRAARLRRPQSSFLSSLETTRPHTPAGTRIFLSEETDPGEDTYRHSYLGVPKHSTWVPTGSPHSKGSYHACAFFLTHSEIDMDIQESPDILRTFLTWKTKIQKKQRKKGTWRNAVLRAEENYTSKTLKNVFRKQREDKEPLN